MPSSSGYPPSSHPQILDTHIHLFTEERFPHLNWLTSDSPLYANHSVPEYTKCISPALKPYHRGFVFVETDCRYTDPPEQASTTELSKAWAHVLEEYSYVYHISQFDEAPLTGQIPVGGIVPWAPVHLGPAMLDRYLELLNVIGGVTLEAHTGKVKQRKSMLKGFRQLLQNKPRGTMLTDEFVEGLKWIGKKGLIFEVGLDTRSTGLWQLEEFIALLERLGDEAPTLVINHLCKPDFHIPPSELPSHPTFLTFSTLLQQISTYPTTIMKLSGIFSELPLLPFNPIPPQFPTAPHLPLTLEPTPEDIIARIYPWVSLAVDLFTPERVIWGSDWPMCNAHYQGSNVKKSILSASVMNADAWGTWAGLTDWVLNELEKEGKINGVSREGIWGGNGSRVYGVDW
ncbi:hypothetical protein L211DRAFT_788483 [Terfezia boudieri ATCC MYA-4762]|uniref:Amidohydrolase-related domain-containing protein n=1 Tax=Terfezia boudieri ATCC MYA-4762 TaxID=1051890 RepID=A0A3N4LMM7_9PEZI|nr:hypothetical protein L211DRAFT_788483 [Terfezia boudieri ATCC MYA-4762]